MGDIKNWLRSFVPAAIPAGRRERLRASVGAGLGLLLAGWLSRLTLGEAGPWFVAPMGASAVLLFAVPASPLAQPWSVIGGNVSAALIGIACARHIGDPLLAVAVAEALAIGTMFALRCLHPPSGAVAVTTVLGGHAVYAAGYGFAFWPVGLNSALLLGAALLYNNLAGRRYPHVVAHPGNPHRTADPLPSARTGFSRADIDRALTEHKALLDVRREDLEQLFLSAEAHAYRRHFGSIRCLHLMSRDVVTVRPDEAPAVAWRLLGEHRVRALPVVDQAGVLQGIVSVGDFVAGSQPGSIDRAWPERIEQMMTRKVHVATRLQPVTELVPLFSDRGFHHLPVIDAERRVVGMVTQSDLLAALYRARLEEAA